MAVKWTPKQIGQLDRFPGCQQVVSLPAHAAAAIGDGDVTKARSGRAHAAPNEGAFGRGGPGRARSKRGRGENMAALHATGTGFGVVPGITADDRDRGGSCHPEAGFRETPHRHSTVMFA
jgi:hypothetical protein